MCYNKGTAIDWNSYQEELIGWICSFYRGSYFILVYEQLSLLHTNSYENKTKPKTRRVIYNKDFIETVFSWNDSVHNLLYVEFENPPIWGLQRIIRVGSFLYSQELSRTPSNSFYRRTNEAHLQQH